MGGDDAAVPRFSRRPASFRVVLTRAIAIHGERWARNRVADHINPIRRLLPRVLMIKSFDSNLGMRIPDVVNSAQMLEIL